MGAYQVRLVVKVDCYAGPNAAGWKIWPASAQVWLTRGTDRVFWAAFRNPGAAYIAGPPSEGGKPQGNELLFFKEFAPGELAALEEWRDGQDTKLVAVVSGFGVADTHERSAGQPGTFEQAETTVARSRWSDLLYDLKFRDVVHLQVPIATDPRIGQAGVRLQEALGDLARGDYQAVALAARKGFEALGQAGFGRRTPRDIEDWLGVGRERAGYTLEERTAAVQTVARLLSHSGAHEGEQEPRLRRFDAELLLALLAGLIRVAPHRLQNVEPVPGPPRT